jgi:hypothetical protein
MPVPPVRETARYSQASPPPPQLNNAAIIGVCGAWVPISILDNKEPKALRKNFLYLFMAEDLLSVTAIVW